MDQGGGETYALFVSFGQLSKSLFAFRRQAYLPDDGFYFILFVLDLVEISNKVKIFTHIHIGIEGVCLGQVTYLFFRIEGMILHIDAADGSLSAILAKIAGDDLHRSGFAGPVGSQEADDLTLADGERNGIDRLLFAI